MVKGTTLREKDKVFTLTIPIQHSIGSPGQSNQQETNNNNKNNWSQPTTHPSKKKKKKHIWIGTDEVKLLMFADDTVFFFIEDLKDSIKNLSELINTIREVAGHKFNKQKSVTFLYTNND